MFKTKQIFSLRFQVFAPSHNRRFKQLLSFRVPESFSSRKIFILAERTRFALISNCANRPNVIRKLKHRTLKILNWFRKTGEKSEFEKAFSDLKNLERIDSNAEIVYDLLKELNSETTEYKSRILVDELNKIEFHSNTNDYFYFYFPIVSHILFFKPHYEKQLLKYLIEPNFANGSTNTKELLELIPDAMKYKLSQDKSYLTTESIQWISEKFPKMENEVEREVQKCWKELNE